MKDLLSWPGIERIALKKLIDYLEIMRPVKVVVFIKDADFVKLVKKSNNISQSFKRRKVMIKEEIKHFIIEEEIKCFTYKYKKPINVGKMYLLSNILKGLVVVPGHPVILNCDTPTE